MLSSWLDLDAACSWEFSSTGKEFFFSVSDSFDNSRVVRPRSHQLLKEVTTKNSKKDFGKETGFSEMSSLEEEMRQYALEIANPNNTIKWNLVLF